MTQKKMQLKDCICPICKSLHDIGHGKGKRQSLYCSECYPRYRTLYNILDSSRYRAKQSHIEFSLDIMWLIAQGRQCKYTGLEFTWESNGANYLTRASTTPSIDKINPVGGYTKDNCQLVCWWYNVSKQQYSDAEVLELCRRVVNFSETKPAQIVSPLAKIEVLIT